ncbi:MAG: rod shape-determining protein MreC [Patescibacteria group bacterium]
MKTVFPKSNIVSFVLLTVIIVAILLTPAGSVIRRFAWRIGGEPITLFSAWGKKINDFGRAFSQIGSLRQENRKLQEQLQSLEVDRAKISELEYENMLLKRELGFIESDRSRELIPARIIAREPSSFLDYIIIDRGEESGARVNLPVISEGVLVGQISEVYDSQAKVILVTSKDSYIQAMLQDSRSKGILRGGISGLTLEKVTQDTEVVPGENVITSGLGGELPPGILIGHAQRALTPESEILKSIVVEPIADLSRLEIVFIMK